MSQWLPSSGQQWIVQLVVIAILGVVARGYFTASAEARLLDDQLTVALDSVEVVTDSLVSERAVSDALIAAQDSAQAADTAAVNAVAVVSDSTASETARALAEAREAAAGMPVVQAALERAETALAASEAARLEERATSAAAVFAGQQRERTLGMQLINERAASDLVISGLRGSLSISMDESDAWERAAKPGALTQIWRQGRAAIVAVILVTALSN
jgi:hypothetical protein